MGPGPAEDRPARRSVPSARAGGGPPRPPTSPARSRARAGRVSRASRAPR